MADSIALDCSGEPYIADLSDKAAGSCVAGRKAKIAHRG
jgi:hypothetical protein